VEIKMKKNANYDTYLPGCSVDLGTMNIVSARRDIGGQVRTKRVRDAFIDLDPEVKRTLKLTKVSYVEKDGILIVLGDSALAMANLFKREVRRPLSKGVISPGETDAQGVLSLLVHNVLEDPVVENEHCYYSVPSSPIDDQNQDVVYHTEIFRKIITEHGYTAHPTNEAMAIIYSQCAAENFSGLAASFGAGMINVALAYQTVKGMDFSVSRCLSDTFPILTKSGGSKTPSEIIPGKDQVLDANGEWVDVLEVVDNGVRDALLEVHLENLPSFPMAVTPEHRMFVHNRFGWSWKNASELTEGDLLGVPVIAHKGTSGSSYYFGRRNDKNVTVATARNLGRFFGIFLGDGSCGPYKEGPEFVQIAVNRRDQHIVTKYATVLQTLFGNFAESVGGMGVQIANDPAEEITRLKLHSTIIARHMKDKFYGDLGQKMCPLDPSRISDQMAIGILEGLLDSDGYECAKSYSIDNTSLEVVGLIHHLLNRFGLEHSIIAREPRLGGVNRRGVQIEGKKIGYNVRIGGHVAKSLLKSLIRYDKHQVWDRFAPFLLYKVSKITPVSYGRHVWDLVVKSDHHSFSSWGAVVHNCGDWVDAHAAKALDSTSARVCSIKEKGINLAKPASREEEAIALYVRSVIQYGLENISAQFRRVQTSLNLPDPVPFIVSGGTSKAGGFLDVFKEEFAAIQKRGFPIQISEIRPAVDPMTAVAEGLLVLASEEYTEE
jgi:hypothetical protein